MVAVGWRQLICCVGVSTRQQTQNASPTGVWGAGYRESLSGHS